MEHHGGASDWVRASRPLPRGGAPFPLSQRLTELEDPPPVGHYTPKNSAVGLTAMKHYMAVARELRNPDAPVLDLGCGAGHDLTVLESVGLGAVGSTELGHGGRSGGPLPVARSVGGRRAAAFRQGSVLRVLDRAGTHSMRPSCLDM